MASYDFTWKIMMLGDAAVGKTSLTIRYISGFFLDDLKLTIGVDFYSKTTNFKDKKVIVEHTSINPNKSAHIGHLRNSCLGDTLAKSLTFLGYDVEVQNYIDDTGIQVADVVWGLLYQEKKNITEIEKIKNLDSYLWSLYSEVGRVVETDNRSKEERDRVHKRIEERARCGGPKEASEALRQGWEESQEAEVQKLLFRYRN